MINLIIDFNNMLHRTLFTDSCNSKGSMKTYDSDEDINAFICKLTTDICYIIRDVIPSKTIMLVDGKDLWRKKIYPEYKANRHKDDGRNWTKIYKATDELLDIFKSKGVIISKIEHAEADDLAAYYKEQLFDQKGESIIFVSSDKDWLQLVDFNTLSNSFVVVYNPIVNNKKIKRLFCSSSFESWMTAPSDPMDIFSIGSTNANKDAMVNFQRVNSSMKMTVVDPNYILINKVFCGDDGDNVPAFWEYYKNGKLVRVTESILKKVQGISGILLADDLDNVLKTSTIKTSIETVMKTEVNDIDCEERLDRQRKLVELNLKLFPTSIVGDFDKQFESIKPTDGVIAGVSSIKYSYFLNGSKFYLDRTSNVGINSVFKDFGNMDNYIKNKGLF
jgi:5'-3' exonuclease